MKKTRCHLRILSNLSVYDEDNLPNYEEERDAFLKTIHEIKKLIENEQAIYRSYRDQLDSDAKKKEMLTRVKENKEKISQTIQSIKFSNKLIRKFGKRIEKIIERLMKNMNLLSKPKKHWRPFLVLLIQNMVSLKYLYVVHIKV